MVAQFRHGYALLVGVGRYQHSALTVPSTANDAEDLEAILCHPDYCAYPPNQIELLTHEKATSGEIRQSLDHLATRIKGGEATVILFFSGHGWSENGQHYFLCHDSEFYHDASMNRIRVKTETAISNETFVSAIRNVRQEANKTLVVFNTCFSGGFGTALAVDNSEFQPHLAAIPLSPLNEGLQDLLADGRGTALFTSSQQGEKSYILGPITQPERNSLFVQKFMAGLKGEGISGEGTTINLLPFIDSVKRAVRETARQYHLDQDPDYKIYGGMQGEFPIALRLGGASLNPGVIGSSKQPIGLGAKSIKDHYNLKVVRELLVATFTTETLERFLRENENPIIRKAQRDLSQRMGIDQMIDVVLDHCLRFLTIDHLLQDVQDYNPDQYAQYANFIKR